MEELKVRITAKIVKTFDNAGKLKAIATVSLGNEFLVTGVRVVDCEKGLTVFMPSMKDKAGEYRDVCFPITAPCRTQFNNAVLNAYDRHLKETEREE